MNFYAFNIGDYAGATRHLSWDEDMAYRRMLDAYYSREAPLPLEPRQIYRLVGAAEPRQREAVDAILEEFFERREDGWHNNRADEEIAKAQLKKAKAQQSAAMRWQTGAHSGGNANASNRHANASTNDAYAQRPQSEGNAPNPNPNPNPNKERGVGVTRAREFAQAEALYQLPELAKHPVITDLMLAPIIDLMVEEKIDFDTVIVPSIRRQATNASRPIDGWRYFVKGIRRDAQYPVVEGAPHGSQPRRRSTPGQDMRDAIAAVQAHVAERD